jgi:mycothiol system anti-sigma-R factor
VLRQIELYLDGELVGQIRLEVERHLGDCHPCSGHAEFQRHLKEMLRSKCGCDHVPEELAERIRVMFGPAPPVQG